MSYLNIVTGGVSRTLDFLTNTPVKRYSTVAVLALAIFSTFVYGYRNIDYKMHLLEQGSGRFRIQREREELQRYSPLRLCAPIVLFGLLNLALGVILARR